MEIASINKEPVEYKGRNYVGNIYKYRWVVYVVDENHTSRTEVYYMDEWVKVTKAFVGTKPEVKRWMRDNGLEYYGDW